MEKTKKGYYVFTEGYSGEGDIGTVYLGNLEIWPRIGTWDPDCEVYDWETDNDDDFWKSTYISDKWGGKEVIDIPDYVHLEFSNGLIDHGTFDTKEEALEVYNKLSEGTIKFDELEIW